MRGAKFHGILVGGSFLLCLWGVVQATGGVYTQTKHGNTTTGVLRLSGEPVSDCTHCHDQHASRNGTPTGGPFPYLLFTNNDNQLCGTTGGAAGCHASAGSLDIFPGPTIYDNSLHQTSTSVVWPGPDPRARQAGDAGLCLNCHTPHGRGDVDGLIPSQIAVREEGSCTTCHDLSGPAATDVSSDINKSSRHPAVDYPDRHDAAEGGNPAAFGAANRHAECEDCHNPHDVRADAVPPSPPTGSNRIQRVSRVAVANGAAGTVPTYTYRGPDDPSTVLEYELCFKCHSSWTTQPVGQADISVRFNPANPSYHPVEAQGKNLNILAGAFVNGWAPTDLMYCADCHGSDDGLVEGVHGSIYTPIVRGPLTQTPPPATNHFCFDCHNVDTYLNGNDSNTRWSSHDSHSDDAVCTTCHDPHGPPNPSDPNCIDLSDNQARCLALIKIVPVGSPVDGITNVEFPTPTEDGSCTATCHNPKRFRWVNGYPDR